MLLFYFICINIIQSGFYFPFFQNQGTINDIQGANIMTTFFIEDLYAIASVQNNKKVPN